MDKIKEFFIRHNANELHKSVITLFAILYLTIFSIGMSVLRNYESIFYRIIFSTLALPALLLVFLPALLLIFFIFKITKNKSARISAFVWLIPLNIVLYAVISTFCYNYEALENFASGLMAVASITGIISVFALLPTLILILLFIPKKFLPIKWSALVTSALMEISGFILMVCTMVFLFSGDSADTISDNLKEYDPMIQYIEEYKAQNGRYPEKIEVKFNLKKYSNYIYQTYENGNDFKLCVDSRDKIGLGYTSFRYCSSEKPRNCEKGKEYDTRGNWNLAEYIDCREDPK